MFYVCEGKYYRVNSPDGLVYINIMLQDFPFSLNDFQDGLKTNSLIGKFSDLYDEKFGYFFTSQEIKLIPEDLIINTWLNGQKDKIDEFYQLVKYSVEIDKTGEFRMQFNTFNPDGSVDHWDIKGLFDNEIDRLKVISIDIVEAKEKQTYNYSIVG